MCQNHYSMNAVWGNTWYGLKFVMYVGERFQRAEKMRDIRCLNYIYFVWLVFLLLRSPSLAAAKPQCDGCPAAKPEFASCQTRVWPRPNPILAAAKPEFGSCQTRFWRLPSWQARVWQLPNPRLAAAKPVFGSCQTRLVHMLSQLSYNILYII